MIMNKSNISNKISNKSGVCLAFVSIFTLLPYLLMFVFQRKQDLFYQCGFFFQEGFAQPDQENGNGDLDDANGLTVGSNGNGSALVGGDEDTY